MLSQIHGLRSLPGEFWAAAAAFLTGAALVAKKLLSRHDRVKPEYLTRAEFQREMTGMRDRVGAGYLALGDKIDASRKEVLSAVDRLAVMTEERLDRLETGLARVDERTKIQPKTFEIEPRITNHG